MVGYSLQSITRRFYQRVISQSGSWGAIEKGGREFLVEARATSSAMPVWQLVPDVAGDGKKARLEEKENKNKIEGKGW